MENSSDIFKNGVKEIHGELVRISRIFEELTVRVQQNHEEYICQLKILNTAIQKAVKKQASHTPSKALGGQEGRKIIVSDKPKNFNSAKEPLPSVENQKTLGGQDPQWPTDFILADECKKIFEQIVLKKPTFKELFNLFGVAIFAENKIFQSHLIFWLVLILLIGFVEPIKK